MPTRCNRGLHLVGILFPHETLHHYSRLFPESQGILTQNINIDILVDITETVGGIAPIVPCIILFQIVDDNAVWSHLAAWIDSTLGDGATIVDPLYLRFRYPRSFAVEFNCFILRSIYIFWLLSKVRNSYNIKV